jgi:hypothetical protein
MEPGLDRHEWQTRLEQLQPELEEAPEATLPDLADLIEEMLEARGYELHEQTTEEGDEPEIVATYEAARETATRAEAGEADPGDVGDAINGLRALFDTLIVERTTP